LKSIKWKIEITELKFRITKVKETSAEVSKEKYEPGQLSIEDQEAEKEIKLKMKQNTLLC
jgi:hypothetical protein